MLWRRSIEQLSKRSRCSSCLPRKCCHGATQIQGSALWTLQFPLDHGWMISFISSQQPASLTPQWWEPRNELTTKQAPNKFPSPQVNGLSPARREMSPNLPLGQGAGITKDNIFSHWLHILLPRGANWKQEQLLPWEAELCFFSHSWNFCPCTLPAPALVHSATAISACALTVFFHVYYHPSRY